MEVRHVTQASEAELDRMADILMDAFNDDAILKRISGNSLKNLRHGLRARAAATIPREGVWSAMMGDEMMGLMVCDLPGQESPEGLLGAISKVKDADPVSDEIREWANTQVRPPIQKLEHESFGPNGERDSMYVHFLAVDPAARGQGVGKVLLKEAFRVADDEGVRVTLLNPKEGNLAIYSRLGFVEAGKVVIEQPEGKYPLWTMFREPSKS